MKVSFKDFKKFALKPLNLFHFLVLGLFVFFTFNHIQNFWIVFFFGGVSAAVYTIASISIVLLIADYFLHRIFKV